MASLIERHSNRITSRGRSIVKAYSPYVQAKNSLLAKYGVLQSYHELPRPSSLFTEPSICFESNFKNEAPQKVVFRHLASVE
jgi:hypothetical protein